jgi:hypothetical protein
LGLEPVEARAIVRVQQVPDQNELIIGSSGKHSSAGWRPLYCIEGGRMASEFKQGLAWLSHVENPRDVRIRGKSRKQM